MSFKTECEKNAISASVPLLRSIKLKILRKSLSVLLFLLNVHLGYTQEYFVHPFEGSDTNNGTIENPVRSIEEAITRANRLTGEGAITINLMPGTYVLQDKLIINPVRMLNDSNPLTIKAYHMPDDEDWAPELMPTIQSISKNNSSTFFEHSVGFLIASNNVVFKGIRFLGNSNPQVKYYYPITKENKALKRLSVLQCMFIGDKESAKIQGGIWVHGPNTVIDHSIFYECRNAILLFDNVAGFRISNSIIYKSYESAFWLGPEDMEFEFYNNILLSNSNLLVGRSADLKYSSPFRESIISDNDTNGKVGYWSREKGTIVPITNPNIKMINITNDNSLGIVENEEAVLPKRHLHVTNWTVDREEPGIFINQ